MEHRTITNARVRAALGIGLASSLAFLLARQAVAQDAPPPVAPPAAPSPAFAPEFPSAPPPPAPAGQWVNTAQYGWLWIPAGTTTYAVDGVPFAYLYLPAHGWTWCASPWGWGPFAYGPWIGRPSPFGFRVWVQGPVGWGWYYGPRVLPRRHGYWYYRGGRHHHGRHHGRHHGPYAQWHYRRHY